MDLVTLNRSNVRIQTDSGPSLEVLLSFLSSTKYSFGKGPSPSLFMTRQDFRGRLFETIILVKREPVFEGENN